MLVEAGRLGLIEAAMFGLREPAGEEGDLVGRVRRAGDERQGDGERCAGGANMRHGLWFLWPMFRLRLDRRCTMRARLCLTALWVNLNCN